MATFNLLKDRFKENKFTDERLKDSINHVIDTYEGWDKLPNIANFIQYDKKVKAFTYEQVIEHNHKFPGSMKYFRQLKNGKWARVEDIEQYKLEIK